MATNLIEHIKQEEGVVYESYLDSLKKPTGGVGHLLTEEEQKLYPIKYVNGKAIGTKIPANVVEQWLQEDLQWAKKAATQQAKKIEDATPEFINSLAAVNFQLGPEWYKEHKDTWKYLTTGQYEKAAKEVFDSKWHTQTPRRTNAFSEAIKKFNKSKQLNIYNKSQQINEEQVMGYLNGR